MRTVRGYSIEPNPKYIRDVIIVLGLEDAKAVATPSVKRTPTTGAKPVMTPSVKRTPTTESLVELEGERRATHRTAVGRLLYICQERADIMYSVKETARKIICPTESDGMNVKRVVRYLKGAPSAKCLIEIVTPPKVCERVHRQRLGRSTNDMQKYKWRSCAVEQRSMVTNTANGEPEFC